MQGTDPFLPPAASGGDSENAAPAGQERRAAPSRRRQRGRTPSPGAPAPAPNPDCAPPSPKGRLLHLPAAQPQEAPGGSAPPSSNPRSMRRERPQEGVHLLPSLPGSSAPPEASVGYPTLFPRLTLLRLARPSPPAPTLLLELGFKEGGCMRRWGAGFSSGYLWLAAQKDPLHRLRVSEAITVH